MALQTPQLPSRSPWGYSSGRHRAFPIYARVGRQAMAKFSCRWSCSNSPKLPRCQHLNTTISGVTSLRRYRRSPSLVTGLRVITRNTWYGRSLYEVLMAYI